MTFSLVIILHLNSLDAFYPLYSPMLAMLQNVLGSTRWSFVAIMTVISTVLGMLWYGKLLFGPMYMKAMHFSKDHNPGGMLRSMIYELISRILYFIGMWWIFVTRGKLDFAGSLPVAILIWLVYVFSTQLSITVWSANKKYVLWIVAGNALIQSIIAAYVFSTLIK